MKGYLQRLAASVARPRPGVHPFVGSIFPGALQEVAAEPLPQNYESASTDDGKRVPTRTIASEPPPDLTRRPDSAPEDRVEERAVIARPTEHETFQPLLPRKAAEAEILVMLPETALGDVASEQLPAKQSLAIGSHKDRLDTSFADAAGVEPFLVEDLTTSSWRGEIAQPPTRRLRESPPVVFADAGKRAKAELSPPPRSSERGADDIQIHIGRVEVIAVPPATPRPAVAPARKAMSLDEYLRRRERGAG
jgi:hypothetical protein